MQENLGMQGGQFLERTLLGVPKHPDEELKKSQFQTVAQMRRWLDHNFDDTMRAIGSRQEADSSNPKAPFAKRLLSEIDKNLCETLDEMGVESERYEVRFFSAVGTVMDKAGIDCWVSLVDTETDKTLSSFTIDLTSNRSKNIRGGFVDAVYYYDTEVDDARGRAAIFELPDFSHLVQESTQKLIERAGLVSIH